MNAGGGGGGAFNLINCVKPSTTKIGVQAILGQRAFDGIFVYLPDMSAGSNGIWRYPLSGGKFGTGVIMASGAGLGALSPGAVASARTATCTPV
jgi:hypothetical protein